MSGVGGEVGEMEELLSSMRKARQDMLESRSASKKAAQKREAEKERLGAIIRARAMSRAQLSSTPDAELSTPEADSCQAASAPKNRGENALIPRRFKVHLGTISQL